MTDAITKEEREDWKNNEAPIVPAFLLEQYEAALVAAERRIERLEKALEAIILPFDALDETSCERGCITLEALTSARAALTGKE